MKLDDEIYSLLDRWIFYRDQVLIAKQLNVKRQTVCNVLNRQGSSQRIINAAIKRAVKNKEFQENAIERLRRS